MFRIPSTVIMVALLVTCANCAGNGGRYEFDLDFGQAGTSSRAVARWVVLEETRWVVAMTDPVERNWLGQARVRIGEGDRFDCQVPPATAVPLVVLPPLAYGHASEYRFTVFARGYAATTVYPLGAYGDGPFLLEDGSLAPFGMPVILWMEHAPRYAGSHRDGNFPLGGVKERDGSIRSRVPFRPITIRSLSPDGKDNKLPPLADKLWRNAQDNTFAAQLNALSEAITKGQLDRTTPEVRGLLFDAVTQQFDIFRRDNSLDENPNTTAQTDVLRAARKRYETIKKWAVRRPSGP